MNALDLARWQFGITTIYHLLFMPLSIGLSLLIAIMQTAWFRTGSPKYLAMTRFWASCFCPSVRPAGGQALHRVAEITGSGLSRVELDASAAG